MNEYQEEGKKKERKRPRGSVSVGREEGVEEEAALLFFLVCVCEPLVEPK